MEVKEFPVEDEYKKPNGIKPENVACIREWLKTQPHLPEKYITDLDIIVTYHSCNKSIEVTKQVMDLNYSLRTLFKPYFNNRQFDSALEEVFKNQIFVPLPTKTNDGHSVIYIQGINTDPNVFDCAQYMRAFMMCVDLWQYENGTAPGLEVVINLTGYTIGHMPKIDLKNVQNFCYYVQEAIPVKLKKIHLLFTPSFMDTIINLMKPFVKNEMIHMIIPHSGGFKSIEDRISIEAFPKDVGGNYKTLEELRDEEIQKMRANSSFFENENKKRVTESLRPGKPKTYTDLFGSVEGSFKKLDID